MAVFPIIGAKLRHVQQLRPESRQRRQCTGPKIFKRGKPRSSSYKFRNRQGFSNPANAHRSERILRRKSTQGAASCENQLQIAATILLLTATLSTASFADGSE